MRTIINMQTGEVTQGEDPVIVTEDVIRSRRAEILSALENIDKKSIRSLRENDTVRIQVWENQAAALRAELAGLNG